MYFWLNTLLCPPPRIFLPPKFFLSSQNSVLATCLPKWIPKIKFLNGLPKVPFFLFYQHILSRQIFWWGGTFSRIYFPRKMQGVPEKHSYHVHKMQQAFAQIKRCHVMGNVPWSWLLWLFCVEINNFELVSTVCAENRQCSHLGT